MIIKIIKKIIIKRDKIPLIVGKISSNHNGSKQSFLNHIKTAWSEAIMAVNCPIYPIRSLSFFVIIVKCLILIYRKNYYENEKIKNQYLIKEKTYK